MSIVLFILGFIIFCATVPLRATILVLKANIKLTEAKALSKAVGGITKIGKNIPTADKLLSKGKYVKGALSVAEFVACQAQKVLVKSLTLLLHLLQWVARLLTGMSLLVLSIILLFFVILVASAGGIVLLILDGNFSFGSGSSGNLSGNENCVAGTQGWLDACDDVWQAWRKAGVDYSQSTGSIQAVVDEFGNYRPDCSGYVFACLQEYGLYDKPGSTAPCNTGSLWSYLEKTGKFEKMAFTSGDDLKAGDICCQTATHVQIYMGNGTWYNNGSTGNIPNHDSPWNDNGYWVARMGGGEVYRLKATECETGEPDWDCPEGGLPIPHYKQWEYPQPIGNMTTIAAGGCGYTSIAMIVSYLNDEKVEPTDIIDKVGTKYHCAGAGMYHSGCTEIPALYGVEGVQEVYDPNAVMDALKNGQAVISIQAPGLFTRGGHFIVLRGVTKEGKILVNDPNDNDTKNYITREFDMMSEIDISSNSHKYWIFPKKSKSK